MVVRDHVNQATDLTKALAFNTSRLVNAGKLTNTTTRNFAISCF
jgi:hypothetical protein